MEEVWKFLIYQGKDFNDFEVSNLGNLRNVKTGTLYKQHHNKTGYMQVCVSLGSRNKKKVFKIHRAVAETFIPNPENKSYVNHKDGNKTNNDVCNLEWVTNQENVRYAYDNNLIAPLRGTKSPYSKLSKDEVEYIRDNYIFRDKEFGCRALANKFNINHATVSRIINGKAYVDD